MKFTLIYRIINEGVCGLNETGFVITKFSGFKFLACYCPGCYVQYANGKTWILKLSYKQKK